MTLRDVLIWTSIAAFMMLGFGFARWRLVAARKLADRLVFDLTAQGEQLAANASKTFAARLMMPHAFAIKMQCPPVPEPYLQEWVAFQRRFKRLRLTAFVLALAVLITLKEVFLRR